MAYCTRFCLLADHALSTMDSGRVNQRVVMREEVRSDGG